MELQTTVRIMNNLDFYQSSTVLRSRCSNFLTIEVPVHALGAVLPLKIELEAADVFEFLMRTRPEICGQVSISKKP